jgi:hypothetical protein
VGAGDEGAQLLEQLAVLALQPFFDLFVLKVFPKPLLDHFVGGHVVPPPRFVGTLREVRICPVYVEWVGRVGPQKDPVAWSGRSRDARPTLGAEYPVD